MPTSLQCQISLFTNTTAFLHFWELDINFTADYVIKWADHRCPINTLGSRALGCSIHA